MILRRWRSIACLIRARRIALERVHTFSRSYKTEPLSNRINPKQQTVNLIEQRNNLKIELLSKKLLFLDEKSESLKYNKYGVCAIAQTPETPVF